MAETIEVRRLKSLVRRYQLLVFQLLIEGETYTGGMDCPFCSGNEGYQSANDWEGTPVQHTRCCPTRQAEKLAAEAIEVGVRGQRPGARGRGLGKNQKPKTKNQKPKTKNQTNA